MADEIDVMQERYELLKARVSTDRKSGINTSLIDIQLPYFNALTKMARATYSPDDLARVRDFLTQLESALASAKKGTPFERALHYVQNANDFLRQERFVDAAHVYQKLIAIYEKLDVSDKKLLFGACTALHNKLAAHA